MRKEERYRYIKGVLLKYQTIKGVTDEVLYKVLHIAKTTYTSRKSNPETFTIEEIITLFDYLGVPQEERQI